jgi:hypothetical protein
MLLSVDFDPPKLDFDHPKLGRVPAVSWLDCEWLPEPHIPLHSGSAMEAELFYLASIFCTLFVQIVGS